MKRKNLIVITSLCLCTGCLNNITVEADTRPVSLIPVTTQEFSQQITPARGRIKSSAKPVSVKFRHLKYKLKPGQKRRLNVTIRPSIVTEKPTFASENPEIADFVNGNLLQAKQPGTTYVTATLSNGKHARCKIIVKKKNTPIK